MLGADKLAHCRDHSIDPLVSCSELLIRAAEPLISFAESLGRFTEPLAGFSEPLVNFARSFSCIAGCLPKLGSNLVEPSPGLGCQVRNYFVKFLKVAMTLSQNLDNLIQTIQSFAVRFRGHESIVSYPFSIAHARISAIRLH
jgi:hypothetical protein